MSEIVLDCCVVSNFALSGALGVLEALFTRKAHITEFVAVEVLRGIQAGHAGLEGIPKAVRAGWLRESSLKTREEKRLFEALSRSLGLGEASAIALAKSRGLVFASDDRVARAEAAALGVCLTGTLGILARAVRAGVCDRCAADAYLSGMIEAGFYSPVRSLSAPNLLAYKGALGRALPPDVEAKKTAKAVAARLKKAG
jgi:predicted nucleic acid-binding protein